MARLAEFVAGSMVVAVMAAALVVGLNLSFMPHLEVSVRSITGAWLVILCAGVFTTTVKRAGR